MITSVKTLLIRLKLECTNIYEKEKKILNTTFVPIFVEENIHFHLDLKLIILSRHCENNNPSI